MTASVATYEGKDYFAYINTKNQVCVNGGIVDPASNAKSGAGIEVDETGRKVVTYTNQSNKLCTYIQPPGDSKWYWDNREWDAK